MAKKAVKHSKRSSSKSSGGNIDSLFKTAVPSRGFRNLPTGTYDGFVKPGSAIIEPKSKGSSDYKASLVLIVSEEGDFENREQTARYDLSTEVGVSIFMGDLEAMELGKPSNLAEAAEMLSDSDDVPVEFWVSEPKDEFPPKVRINERLEEGEASEVEEPEETEELLTAKEIKAMSEDELTTLAKDNDLDPDDFESWEDLAAELITLLVE